MDTHEQIVDALKALCDREGGYRLVAERAHVSAQNLWQTLNGVKHPSGRPRSIGREVREKLERAFPGWLSIHPVTAGETPAHYGLAHQVSHHQTSNELPLITWENILKTTTPELFRSALPDDALAPDYPRGTEIVWTTRRRLLPGRIVLVRDRHGSAHARRCHQGRGPGHWLAMATNPAYVSFDNQEDDLVVIAVFKGKLEPDDS